MRKKKDKCKSFSKMKKTVIKVFDTYDRNFLITLGLTYFNQGFKIFTRLAVMDLFRNHLKLEPTYT